MLGGVARRILSLALALLAAFGLLGQRALVVADVHGGGDEAHHHGPTLATFVHHGLAHRLEGHSHATRHSHAFHDDLSPTADDDGRDDDGDDDDHHEHVRTTRDAAMHRAGDTSHGLTAAPDAHVSTPVWLSTRVPATTADARPGSSNDASGHPPSNGRSTIERLVQGLGLLI